MTSSIHRVLAGGIIRYSRVWEDHRVLERGLEIGPSDDVLSIGSSGDNALALLLQEPMSVHAVDVNPSQIALFELKVRAIEALEWDEFVGLLGVRVESNRLGLYERVRKKLSPSSASFWDSRPETLANGVSSSGRLDAFLRGFLDEHEGAIGSRDQWRELLTAPDLATQRELFGTLLRTTQLEQAFLSYFSHERLANEGRDPRQMRYVEEIDVPTFLFRKLSSRLTDCEAKSNFYAHCFLLGGYINAETVPPYLMRDNYARLRSLLPRLRLELIDVKSALLAARPLTYSKASLSDLFEYLSDEAALDLFLTLGRSLRPSGRIAFWNLFVPREPAGAARLCFRPRKELAARLFEEDRTMFYRAFHVEEVVAI